MRLRRRSIVAPSSPCLFAPAPVCNAEAVCRLSSLSRARSASIMSSHATRLPGAVTRNSGAASTAQASDAQEAKIARFSLSVRSGSRTTSIGCANALAGCKRVSRSKTLFLLSLFPSWLFLHAFGEAVRQADHLNPFMALDRCYATLECSMVRTLSPFPTALPVSISIRRGFIASGSSRSSSICSKPSSSEAPFTTT